MAIQAGKYIGRIGECKVDASKNGVIQFVAACELRNIIISGNPEPLTVPQTINAYISLTKQDGSRNTAQMDALMAAFDWDGKSLRGLIGAATTDYDQQFVIVEEEYNGKVAPKVSWINKPGAGGLKPVSESDLDRLESTWVRTGPRAAPARQTPQRNARAADESVPY